MRKTIFVRALWCGLNLFCLAVLGLACQPGFAQDATSAPAPAPAPTAALAIDAPAAAADLPTDPQALMLLAAKSNGLLGTEIRPWRLKASFKILDETGVVKDQGTFEELWVSLTRFRRTYSAAAYTRTEYGTEKGVLYSGAHELPLVQLMEMEREFVSPLPQPEELLNLPFELKQVDSGSLHLACLQARLDQPAPPFLTGRTYCLSHEKPILRISATSLSHTQYIHNHIVNFQGRFVAGDLQFMQAGKPVLTAHLEGVEPLTVANDTLFQPPIDALPLEIKILSIKQEPVSMTINGDRATLSSAVARGFLIKKILPQYPPIAFVARVEGTVVLQAEISKEGRIENLRVLKGPAMLQQASLDAVRQWLYRPYLLEGEPVAVQTTVDVVFSLAGRGPSY
jgi:TonB family protein